MTNPSTFAAFSEMPTDMLILLGGFCLILLLGCVSFVIIALVMRNKAERKSEEVIRLKTVLLEMQAIKPAKEQIEEKSTADTQEEDLNLTLQLNEAEERYASLQEKLKATEAQLKIAQADILEMNETLREANDNGEDLQRQLRDANDRVEASGNGMMNELIVNFTAESREMMSKVEDLERENSEFKQMILDMESSEKGTTGTVVGLKRKLQQAEERIELLQEEAALLRRQQNSKTKQPPRAS